MTFNFLGLLYFWYSVYAKTGNYLLFFIFFLLALLMVSLLCKALPKFFRYNYVVSDVMVLTSVFLGLGALKIVLTLLNELQ